MQLTSIKRGILTTLLTFLSVWQSNAQIGTGTEKATRQDSLRGSLNEERNWWDVLRYDISVTPDYEQKTISGSVTMTFKVTGNGNRMQIDLQEPMQLDAVILAGSGVSYVREGNV